MKARAPIRPTHPRKVKNPQQPNEKKPEEKKTTSSTNSSAPKVTKSHSKRPDIFELQKPFVTSFSSVSDVVKAFANGTDELRNLLNFECELIYECKVCRGLFRSLSNFLQHKRSHCLERSHDLKRNLLNGEATDKVIHINGTNPKGQLIATRKTVRKDIYDILRKVGDMTEEPLPEQFFTRDIQETSAALLSFFKQEGKAATEEKSATLGNDGFIVGAKPEPTISDDKPMSKVIPPSEATSDVCSKQSDASSRQSDASSRQSDVSSRPSDGENSRISSFKCSKCDEAFCSQSELTAHANLQSCSKLRRCFVCPLCKKIVATPWNVYRHLRRVHNKTAEQVRKLRKNIEKRMVRAEEIKSRSPPSPVRKPVISEKTQEIMRSFGNNCQVSVGVNCGPSQLTTPVLFKRERSPDVEVSVKNRILEVRSYDKTLQFSPSKNGPDSTSSKSQQPEVSVSTCVRNAPQPCVLLTRTLLDPTMCASVINQEPTSPQYVPNSPSTTDLLPNPPKKIKIEKDLSWLKKGPSVPIVGGPLTRTARALYGSPRKINPSESDKAEWNKSVGKISGVESEIQKDERESIEAEPCRSAQDDSSENEVENPSGPEDVSPSDGDDNDSDDPSEAVGKKTKDTSSSINKRLSSSEDNVRSLTSSVDSFDSPPSKKKNAVQDLNDGMSTSGVETEVDRPTTTTSSAGPSDDDSPDLLIDMYSKDSPPPLIRCDGTNSTCPPNQSPSDYLESVEEEQMDPLDEASCHNHPPDITSDADYSGLASETKPAAPSARTKSTQSRIFRHKSPARETNEDERTCRDLATSLAAPEEVKAFFDSEDSNSPDEEEHDDQLRQNMMEVIFGTLSPTSFNVSCVLDSSSS